MPFYFEFDAGNLIVRIRLEGRINDLELLECYRQCFQAAAMVKPRAAIFDVSEVLEFNVSSETIRYLASSDLPFPAGAARFVVAPTDFLFGMSRMYQTLGEEKRELRVVRSAEEAYRKLGVTEVHFEPVPQTELSGVSGIKSPHS